MAYTGKYRCPECLGAGEIWEEGYYDDPNNGGTDIPYYEDESDQCWLCEGTGEIGWVDRMMGREAMVS